MADRSLLRTATFGDLEAGIWGVAFGGEQLALGLGAGSVSRVTPATIAGAGDESEWTVSAGGTELVFSPNGETVDAVDADGEPVGFHQLCRVRGRLAVAEGPEQTLDCLGRRSLQHEPDRRQLESLRDVSAWFATDDGVAVTALRPAKAAGQSADALSAAVFDPAGALHVAESRLSTTYASGGHPARVGLELWIGQEEDDEQYPYRLAGEVVGVRAVGTSGPFDLEAALMRCHSHGVDGAGVYLLARRR